MPFFKNKAIRPEVTEMLLLAFSLPISGGKMRKLGQGPQIKCRSPPFLMLKQMKFKHQKTEEIPYG